MNLSGILVSVETGHVDDVIAALGQLPGVSVEASDRAAGRLVVLQEAADVAAEVASFSRIRALGHVIGADLVTHCFDEGA